ncbi:C40 family peptidase [Weeksella virosa]|uniref:NLP/P60 protein n=1 Tax=Weeksella virosa (strain ATCC 43766 / DSM 16922 / JCM 21250 / CCUG 30538 / CDC 9751 / IAM 14551 / NBRC 16016 / NCTC 11634 / CL345/78) TaxID=865938 RepID=F0NYP2_WEEVC|nr:C40 family peptidase [Weeksella virosa]ADX68173.1 NLP/P60 protein [Weeksella virosa DSM 16922]MDK7374843.1 C40 family peptidase [Weeksella virosa]MDK7675514.1 C40 family peptidase [Weeksella virosa]SUP54484.1 Gamma-D-glutamyl-L-lysine endopeptidase [Weeksella virosa]VEH64192.1 Gamma-D-glutamyl-L-lysine endopeptidase [Weeksella virosa]
MNFGVCRVSVAPVRASNSDSSEMVTQLLFGEKVEVLRTEKKWLKIRNAFDSYEGFVDPKQILFIEEKEYYHLQSTFFASETFNFSIEEGLPLTLPLGAVLLNLQEGKIHFGGKYFDYLGEAATDTQPKSSIPYIAKNYLNVPYLWGGKSTYGIDCSGLVQQVYKLSGVALPRDAYQQAEMGEVLNFLEEAEAGDLAFFDNADGKIIHVGIVLEDKKIIHAHGKVRIDPLDSNGIFNTDYQNYSHKLRILKRVLL